MPVFCDQAGGQRRDERLLGLPGCNAVRETCSGGILDMRGVVHRVGVHIHLPLRGGGRPHLLLEHALRIASSRSALSKSGCFRWNHTAPNLHGMRACTAMR